VKKIILISVILLIIIPIRGLANEDNGEWQVLETISFTIKALGPKSYPTGFEVLTWEEINSTYKDSILFNLTFIPKYPVEGQDFETTDYFILGQEIIAITCYIENMNREIILSNVTLSIYNPDGELLRNISFLEENHTGTNTKKIKLLEDDPLIFNSLGIWKLILNFESNTDNLIWKYLYGWGKEEEYQTFKLTDTQKKVLKKIMFYNEYREGIPVITLSEALDVAATRYSAEQTYYLKKSAIAQEESSQEQEKLSNTTVTLANATVLLAIVTFLSIIEYEFKFLKKLCKKVKKYYKKKIKNQNAKKKKR